jgi:hypothetical protein
VQRAHVGLDPASEVRVVSAGAGMGEGTEPWSGALGRADLARGFDRVLILGRRPSGRPRNVRGARREGSALRRMLA